jgi:hypothetical protein
MTGLPLSARNRNLMALTGKVLKDGKKRATYVSIQNTFLASLSALPGLGIPRLATTDLWGACCGW